jgi:D-alanyl-D-alanine carboxypeptidase
MIVGSVMKMYRLLSRPIAKLLLVTCFVLSTYIVSSPLWSSGPALAKGSEPPFAAQLRPLLEAKMQELRIPGAIIYINYPGQGSWTTTFGTSNLETGAPMSINDHMRIGSITKTFTATVMLQLVEEGKLRLDDPVSKYFPQVPDGSNITIREVLNMTSGLFNYSEDEGFGQTLLAHPDKVWNPWELLAIAFKHPPYFAPGQGLHYSNTNYILLGLLIKKITCMPVEKVFQQRIFRRLGMDTTELPPLSSAAIPNPHPRGYTFETSNAPAPLDVTFWSPSWGWTAGSGISTLHDLNIWAKALETGTLLSPAMQRERLTFVPYPGTPWLGHRLGYGLGIADFGGVIGHNGAIPGFQSFMVYYPQKRVTIVVLTNLDTAPNGTGPADELEMVIQKHLQLFG